MVEEVGEGEEDRDSIGFLWHLQSVLMQCVGGWDGIITATIIECWC